MLNVVIKLELHQDLEKPVGATQILRTSRFDAMFEDAARAIELYVAIATVLAEQAARYAKDAQAKETPDAVAE